MRFWRRRRAPEPVAVALESEARLIEGARRTSVRLMLEERAITYRGHGLHRTIGLDAIHRVEYASYIVSGGIPNGTILRLACADATLEFVLDSDGGEWGRRLPAT